eukprot:3059147-Rhodomonas_salina.1
MSGTGGGGTAVECHSTAVLRYATGTVSTDEACCGTRQCDGTVWSAGGGGGGGSVASAWYCPSLCTSSRVRPREYHWLKRWSYPGAQSY